MTVQPMIIYLSNNFINFDILVYLYKNMCIFDKTISIDIQNL